MGDGDNDMSRASAMRSSNISYSRSSTTYKAASASVEVWRLEIRSTSDALLDCIKRQPEAFLSELCSAMNLFTIEQHEQESSSVALLTLIN